jgi:hypothetical protein
MQKLINLLALASFGVSAAVVGGGAYLYLNKDTLIEEAREKAVKAVTNAVTEALPGMINGAMPEMPKMTGGAIPGGTSLPTTTGLPKSPF